MNVFSEDTQGAIDKLHRLSQKPNIDLMDKDTRSDTIS